MYRSTKKYGHELGLSACFRQHRATHSHCSLLHGYALAFTFVFEAETLDGCNWVQDFGGLKELKERLQKTFDHKLLVAEDDPHKDELCGLAGLGLADVLVVGAVGCEAFARMAYDMARGVIGRSNEDEWRNDRTLAKRLRPDRVRIVSVECAEHSGNSAIYKP